MNTEREEYGHKFAFNDTQRPIVGWESVGEGNPVFVSPPQKDTPEWTVWVPHMEEALGFVGPDAEERAFGVAGLFIEQDTTPLQGSR